MKIKYIKHKAGITLPEILTVTILFSIICGAFYLTLMQGTTSWQVTSARTELQQNLRIAASWMTRDLRQSGTAVISDVDADGSPNSTITFKIVNGVSSGNIVWSTTTLNYALNNNVLERTIQGSSPAPITQNIKALSISRQSATPNIVEVTLTGEKTTVKGHTLELALDFNVKVRN